MLIKERGNTFVEDEKEALKNRKGEYMGPGALQYAKVRWMCGSNAPVRTKTFPKKAPPFQEIFHAKISLKQTVVRIVCAAQPHTKIRGEPSLPPPLKTHKMQLVTQCEPTSSCECTD